MKEKYSVFLFLIMLVLGFCLKTAQADDTEAADKQKSLEEKIEDQKTLDLTPLPLEYIKNFSEIFARIKSQYVEKVSDEELFEYAITGMLNGLDPHSVYLKDEKLEALNKGTTGKFSGLGVEVVLEKGVLKVISPIDDTPAAKAGVKSGDIIVKIDGKLVSGNNLQKASERLKGEPGTDVTLTIVREDEIQPFDITITRAIIRVNTVKQRQYGENIAYLKITQFQTKTAELFRKKINEIKIQDNIQGLILDLRNNPGGLLQPAIAVSDVFLDEGVIVSTKGRFKQSEQVYHASPGDSLSNKPVVLLINSGSASASEIVAGALQDNQRAIILGTPSFGKGSVQTVMNITPKEAIKLTTARYYTPNGTSIQAKGIQPDILVEQIATNRKNDSVLQKVSENDLQGHLESRNEEKETETVSNQLSAKEKSALNKDYQLNQAYNLLTGLMIANSLSHKSK